MEEPKNDKEDFDEDSTVDTTQILLDAKQCFNATSVNPGKLISVLTRCVNILHRGDTLAQKEATDLFFHITRLFQYKEKNSVLRRLTYISIKALSKQAENVYVVSSILTNDVNSTREDPAIRASALRALCQVTDASAFISIERYIKQSIVDKHPVVASAAISSLIRIGQVNNEIVRRCTNEIQEALKADSPMVQYHALALLHNSSRNDRLSVARLISDCIDLGLKSPLAICLLIRIIVKYLNDCDDGEDKKYRDYLRDQMNQRSEMVEFEAANALISLKAGEPELRKAAVSHLKNFLTSSKPALRFATVRILIDHLDYEDRFWAVNRVGNVCKLHLLHRRYRPDDHIIGLLDFSESTDRCAKCTIIFESEDAQQIKMDQFCLDTLRTDFALQIPTTAASVETSFSQPSKLHCVLSFIFHIVDKDHTKELYEDRIGTIELAPSKIQTKPFRCDFPIAVYTGR